MRNKYKLTKNGITDNAQPGDPLVGVQDPTPGAEGINDLGEPVVNPRDTQSIGQRAAARIIQSKSKVNANAVPAEPMQKLGEEIDVDDDFEDDDYEDDDYDYEDDDYEDELEESIQQKFLEQYDKTAIKVDIDSLNTLYENDESVSEDFKNKLAVLFEATVKEKVFSILDEVEVFYEEQLDLELSKITDILIEEIDNKLDYVAQQWYKDNELSIEYGTRNEITEQFIGGLKTLFEEHYIDVPESKYNVLDELSEISIDLENRLNSQIEENALLTDYIKELLIENKINKYGECLSSVKKDHFKQLAENIDFLSEEELDNKLTIIKESLETVNSKSQYTLMEDVLLVEEEEYTTPAMKSYIEALKKY